MAGRRTPRLRVIKMSELAAGWTSTLTYKVHTQHDGLLKEGFGESSSAKRRKQKVKFEAGVPHARPDPVQGPTHAGMAILKMRKNPTKRGYR